VTPRHPDHDRPLSPAARAALRDLADALIPGGEGMPAASSVGTHEALIDRVMAVRPQATPAFAALLERLAGEADLDPGPRSATKRAQYRRRERPADFSLLAGFVVGAYQLDDRVRSAIGYPGQGPSDVTFEDETGYIAEGLLGPVLERGPRVPGV